MIKSLNKLTVVFIVNIIILLLFFLNHFILSNALSVIGLIIYLVIIFYIIKYFTINILFFSFIIYAYIFQIFSLLFLEMGAFSTELNKYGYCNNSTLFLMSVSFFILYPIILIKTKINKVNIKSNRLSILLSIIIYSYIFLMIVNIYFNGAPIFLGINRQSYWVDYTGNRIVYIIYGRSSIFGFLLGIRYWLGTKKKDQIDVIFQFLLCVIVYILYGTKFSGIIIFIYLFMLPIILRFNNDAEVYSYLKYLLKKYIFPVSLFFFILISFSYSLMLQSQKKNIEMKVVIEMITNRIAQQGQLFWEANNFLKNKKILRTSINITNEIVDGISRIDYPNIKSKSGMIILIKNLASKNVAYYYPKDGITLTAGSDALALIQYGYYGLIVYRMVSAFIIFVFFRIFLNYTKKAKILVFLLLNEIYWYVIIGAFFDGRFQRVYDIKNIVILFILVIYMLYEYSLKVNTHERIIYE